MKCKCSFHNAAECALVDNAQRINTTSQHFPLYYWLALNQFATELFRNKILSRTVNCTGNQIYFQDSFTKQRKSTKLQHRSSIKKQKKTDTGRRVHRDHTSEQEHTKGTLYRGNASNAQMRPAEEGVDHAARNGRSVDCHRQQFRLIGESLYRLGQYHLSM